MKDEEEWGGVHKDSLKANTYELVYCHDIFWSEKKNKRRDNIAFLVSCQCSWAGQAPQQSAG
jgi:hypothetical protein